MHDYLPLLFFLWPMIGWFCAFDSTPKWMLKDDPFAWILLIWCGMIVGPFGIVWYFMGHAKRHGEK